MKKVTRLLLGMLLVLLVAGCSSSRKNSDPSAMYASYVQSLLDVSYKHDASGYLEYVDDTEEAVEEYYEDTMEYWAYELADYFQMVLINDEVEERMVNLTEEIFAQARYEVEDAVKTSDYYTVQVTIEPLNFTSQVYDEVVAYAQDFQSRSDEGEYGDYQNNEDDYTAWEVIYANGVMDILDTYVDHLEYADPVERIVKISVAEDGTYGISSEDQNDLESYLIQ
jgi:hypothetical protein